MANIMKQAPLVCLSAALGIIAMPVVADEFSFDDEFEFDFETATSDYDTQTEPSSVVTTLSHAIGIVHQKEDTQLNNHQLALNIKYERSVNTWLYFNSDFDAGVSLEKDIVLEEFYRINALNFQASKGAHSLSIGKQKVTWGEVEGAQALDVITPLSLSANQEEQAATQWLANYRYYGDGWQVSSVLVPDAKVQNLLPLQLDDELATELGVQAKAQVWQSDIALYGGSFIDDFSVFALTKAKLDRFYLLGASANRSIGSLLLKLDVGYKANLAAIDKMTFSLESQALSRVDSAFGLEYGFSSGPSITLMAQSQYYLNDIDSWLSALSLQPLSQHQGFAALMAQDSYLNDDLSVNLALAFDVKFDFVTAQSSVSYKYNDNWSSTLDASYTEAAPDSQFSAMDRQINLSMTTKYGF